MTLDIRHSLRALRRTPAFTLGAIVTLALAIGANAAIFSAVHGVLLRQLPFRQPDRVFWIWSDQPDRDRAPFNVPDFADYRDQSRTLQGLAGFFEASANLSDSDSTERLQGIRATPNAFEVLGVDAAVGRLLRAEDAGAGREHAVVLGQALWKRRFGAATDAIGRSIRLDGESYTVVGVLPDRFVLPIRDVDFAMPFVVETDPRRHARNSLSFVRGVGRLRDGMSRAQAEAELTSIARRLQQQFPVENARKRGVRLVAAVDGIVGPAGTTLVALFGAVVSVLLIACANLANLILGRAAGRRKEVAVRLALGSPRWRIVQHVLTETLLLSLAGGALGLLVAPLAVAAVLRLAPADLPRADGVRIDLVVVCYALGMSLLTGLVFGVLPAFGAARLEANETLRASGRGSTGRTRGVRDALVACEVALAFVLLTVVGLLGKSLANVLAVKPGFDASHMLSARLALPRGRYQDREAIARFQTTLEERLSALATVTRVGSVSVLPLSGSSVRVPFSVEGHPIDRPQVPTAQFRFVSPGYFEAMRIPLLRGHGFTARDTPETPPVAIVSEALAAQWLAPSGDPIGMRLLVDDNDGQPRPIEVVGVVGNVRQMTLDGKPTLDLYLPYPQVHPDTVGLAAGNMFLVIRTQGEPRSLETSLARELRALDPDVAAANVRPLESYLAGSLAPRRFGLVLLSVFGGAALLLALGGVYAVVSYSVTQREREIAIRTALGARSADVVRLVLGQGMRFATLGVLLAIPLALGVTRALGTMLFGVAPTDAATFAEVAVVVLGVAVVACAMPAMRASRLRALPTGD